MKLPKRIVYLLEGVIVLFIGWAAFGIIMNAQSLRTVTVTLSPDGEEYHDKTILGVGKDDRNPDYWLRMRTTEGIVDLGSYANREVGEGLSFTPQQNIPTKEIIGFQLLDKDKFESDVLAEFPYETDELVGVNYTLEIHKGTSLESGFSWFFKTPVGIALLTGLIIGIAVIIIGNGGFTF